MQAPVQSPKAHIPESLRKQLAEFRRVLWRIKIIEALSAGAIGILVSFLLIFTLDRLWPTPSTIRLIVLLAGISLLGIFAPYWIYRWIWKQRREAQLARLISKRFPGLGDRLLGVLELEYQSDHPDALSPQLRAAAMQAVAAEAKNREFAHALPTQKHRLWSLATLTLAAIAITTFVITPRASLNALHRWFFPLSNTERYTFTKLDNPPHSLIVPYGEAFTITLTLANDSEHHPASGSISLSSAPAITAPLNQNSYSFTFPGQQSDCTASVTIGDLRHDIQILPKERPSVIATRAIIHPPEYLKLPDQSVSLNSGVVTAVEGSSVTLQLDMNRSLLSGSFGPTRNLTSDTTPPFSPTQGSLSIHEACATTPKINVGSTPFEIPFSWVDSLNLASQPNFKIHVDATKDMPPTCYLQNIERQIYILPEETLSFEVLAEDDFGLKSYGYVWEGEHTRPTPDPTATGEFSFPSPPPSLTRSTSPALFNPKNLNIIPQKITLRAYVEDHFPNRSRIYSEPITIFVLTRDEHAQILKNRFDQQISDLEDLARREQDLLDENERLNQKSGDDLQSQENRDKLQAQTQAEAETQRKIDDLKNRSEQLLKDAIRNGDIDKKTLQKMADATKSLQDLSNEQVPKVEKNLNSSQDAANTPEQSKKDLNQAVEDQKKAVDQMKQAAEQANDANQKFEAGTFVNRLKKASTDERGISDSLKNQFEAILGLNSTQLDPKDARALTQNHTQQANTAADVRWIQEDLGHYFTRTKKEPFKKLLDDIKASNIDTGFDDILSFLSSNHSFKGAENAQKWSKQLADWAKQLEDANSQANNGGGGGSGGGGQPSAEDEDFEFMLRVMKLVQQEQDLRAQTRALESIRRADKSQKPSSPTTPNPQSPTQP